MIQKMKFLLGIRKEWMKTMLFAVMLAAILVVSVVPAFAQEESLELDIDIGLLFDGINDFLPIAFGIFAMIGGILIAFRLAKFIVNAFADALDGKTI